MPRLDRGRSVPLSVQVLFSKFWRVARNSCEVVGDRARFFGKKFCPQDWESGPKMDQKQGFLNFLEIWSVIFTKFDL